MALVEGVKYGLSSHNNQCGKKAVIFVKLTDSALRAIEDYLKSQHKTGHRATLRFLGNEGNIHIPSSSSDNGHSFDFSLSTNTDIESPQGSFECIQQCGPRSLESAGPLSYKMRIKANDDVFGQTKTRFDELEHERQKECAKEIKSNCADIGRKVKNTTGMPQLPQRREKSPSYGHQPPPKPTPNFAKNTSNINLKLPPGYNNGSSVVNKINSNSNRKVVSGPANGNATLPNGSASSSNNITNNKSGVAPAGSGTLDITRRPLKERLIHMLAVKPYKKPELYQRLRSDGLKERDKKLFMPILQQISSFKDNEFSLLRGVWNDVQEDWPFYTEQEKQLLKRRKPQNLTPPGSDSSVGSGTSSLSPRSNSSIGSGHSPSYSHLSSYSKPSVAASGSSEINYKGLTPPEGNSDLSKGMKRPVSSGILVDNVEDYGDIPSKKTRVAHKPGSGSCLNGNGANANSTSNNLTSRAEIVSKQDRDGCSGSSPQFSSHSNRIAERLSPIGTSGSNFSAQNGSNGISGVVQTLSNHKSPRNGNLEPMDVSPVHHSAMNGYHGASQGETVLEESASIGSSWQSRNGNDTHGFSDNEKISRGDSDETDSVDSGNGSSTSGGSLGGSQHQNYSSYHHSNGSHLSTNNGQGGGYTNGPNANNKLADKPDPISSSAYNSVNSSNITNGCNRVSSTTNFHNTPQSSPDSQVDSLQQKAMAMNSMTASAIKHNQRSNGKCNVDTKPEIIVTREKSDSHRDRDRRRNDRDRGKEKERESRSKDKDRIKRGDKKHTRITDEHNRDDHEIENSDGSSVKLTSEYPSYLTKYTTITCPEQRSKYKEDFNAEYVEYRDLHAVIDTVSKRFAHLEERLRQEERGTDGYENIKEQIVNEYYANKRNKKYQDTRQKFQYLHEKLSHIKRLVADYDSQHQQDQDTSNELSNGFIRN